MRIALRSAPLTVYSTGPGSILPTLRLSRRLLTSSTSGHHTCLAVRLPVSRLSHSKLPTSSSNTPCTVAQSRPFVSSHSTRTLPKRSLLPTTSFAPLTSKTPVRNSSTMASTNSIEKLKALRALMKERQIDAYVIPSGDAHTSEYIEDCDARRAFMTSFTGSAGVAVVTQDEARMWTDGRYWLQAGKQLGEGWTLMKQGLTEIPTWQEWLKSDFRPASRIGIDPTLLPFSASKTLSTDLSAEAVNSTLVPVTDNLIDIIWSSGRPPRPTNEVFHLGDEFTGETVGRKLSRLREKLGQTGSPGMVVTELDDVAWLFNLRGSDIPYNPVFFGYAILTQNDCNLFIDPKHINDSVRDYLHKNGVAVMEYEHVWNSLESLGQRVQAQKEETTKAREAGTVDNETKEEKKPPSGEKVVKTDKVLISKKASWAVAKMLGEDNVDARPSYVEEEKAKKNAVEIEGFRQCNIRDGAALCRYFAWLEEVLGKGEKWSEYDAAMVLENYRRENEHFMGLSFQTVSSSGPNAAIIHYMPSKDDSGTIDRSEVYLCDSGAQYLDGTTDTTRTMHFGTPNLEEKLAYTRVLKGVIALTDVIFPPGTSGYALDVIARSALWVDGLDYRHGTSHGVGSFLNVHEGPQGLAPRPPLVEVPLKEGMVISNEPGYYADGKFGIRIENVQVIKMVETRENFGGKGYLGFEYFTMAPIQTKMIQLDLLTEAETKWMNEYHADVKEKVTPLLKKKDDQRALAWLERECQPI